MKSIFFIQFMINLSVYGQSLINNPNFDLIWQEEFNGTALGSNWTVANGLVSGSNFIYQSNSQQNVNVDNGKLNLATRFAGNNLYISDVETNIPTIQGGFYEVKIKFKNGPQTFPTAWVYSGDGKCPATAWGDYQEIDILEFFGDAQSTSGGVHYCTCTCPPNDVDCIRDNLCRNSMSANSNYGINTEGWHLYAAAWRNTAGISFYQDWELKGYRYTPTQMVVVYPNKKFKLGTSFRCYNMGECNADMGNYPYTEEVDYIRIFNIKNNCGEEVTQIPNTSSFNYSLKKSYSLSNKIFTPSTPFIPLYATDFIELKEGVEILEGTNFELGVMPCVQ